MKEKLEQIVLQTRSEVVNDRASEGVKGDPNDYLVGCCVENAEALAERLREKTNWDVTVVKGAVNYPKEPTPNSYERARKDGTLHHWVEVSDGEKVFYCNLVREGRRVYTEPLISRTLPSSYINFN